MFDAADTGGGPVLAFFGPPQSCWVFPYSAGFQYHLIKCCFLMKAHPVLPNLSPVWNSNQNLFRVAFYSNYMLIENLS